MISAGILTEAGVALLEASRLQGLPLVIDQAGVSRSILVCDGTETSLGSNVTLFPPTSIVFSSPAVNVLRSQILLDVLTQNLRAGTVGLYSNGTLVAIASFPGTADVITNADGKFYVLLDLYYLGMTVTGSSLKLAAVSAVRAPLNSTPSQLGSHCENVTYEGLDPSIYAKLDSPIFVGTPTAPTPAPGNNNARLATTAFVTVSFAPITNPHLLGSPTATTAAPGDNSSRIATTAFVMANVNGASLNSPHFTGVPTAPTAPFGTNTYQLATTAFVLANSSIFNLDSPHFTGVPTSPTASPGTSTTQLATTAFVMTAVSAVTFTLPIASSTQLGGVKVGAGLGIIGDGTLSANVTTVAGRTGSVNIGIGDVAGAAPLANPTFSGSVNAPTPSAGNNSTLVATTAFVSLSYATLSSPAFTGIPTAPTATLGTSSMQIATTAFVESSLTSYVPNSSLAVASGVATLDGSGKLDPSQIPATVTGGLSYQGVWNPNTNTPTLADGTGTRGYYYKVSADGTYSIGGNNSWSIGDQIVYNGSTWDKIAGPVENVISVAGRIGVVVLAVADVSGAAPLASPSLSGTPLAPTAATNTNNSQIATTAFVIGQAGSSTPFVNGSASAGSSLSYARQDHVHPTDSSRAAVASPSLTGVPTAPTAAPGTNTTQLATTAFVTAAAATLGSGYLPLAGGTLSGSLYVANSNPTVILNKSAGGYAAIYGQIGGSTRWQVVLGNGTAESGANAGTDFGITRFDDSGSYMDAPLFIARSTGVVSFIANPTVPTPTTGDNTTKAASTAFVQNTVASYLPLTGGTISGGLAVGSLSVNNANPTINLNKTASGGVIQLIGYTNGAPRWNLQLGDGNAETGSSVGSNFSLYYYNDAGALNGQVLSIPRNTGVVNFNSTPTFPTVSSADNGTHAATTAYVQSVAAGYLPLTGGNLSGNLSINTNSYPSLILNKTTGANQLVGYNNGSLRWLIHLGSNSAETGGNSGSDFNIFNYSDTGAYLSSPLGIVRSTGVVNFTAIPILPTATAGTSSTQAANTAFVAAAVSTATGAYLPLTGGTLSGALTVNNTLLVTNTVTVSGANGIISLNKAASGGSTSLYGRTGGLTRWWMELGNGDPESTANAGSNFYLSRYDDAGTYIDSPIYINRSTGVVSLSAATTPTPTAGDNSARVATTAFVVASFAPKANPSFTGDVYLTGRVFSGTPATGGIWLDGGSQQFVGSLSSTQMGLYNNGAWVLTVDSAGKAYAPTPAGGSSDTQIATTAFVATAFAPKVNATFTGRTSVDYLVFGGGSTNVGAMSASVLDAALGGIHNSGRSAFAWNYSAGGGELDLFISRNGGGTGGLQIWDIPAAIGTPTKIFQVDGAGNVYVPGTFYSGAATFVNTVNLTFANPAINLNKSASGQYAGIFGNLNGVPRWFVNLGSADAETGSNAGSAFYIQRYDDAGAYIGNVISIYRNNGIAVFSATPQIPTAGYGTNDTQAASTQFVQTALSAGLGNYLPLVGGQLSGNLSIYSANPAIVLNKIASGGTIQIIGYTASVPRWNLQLGNEASETGANVGSDFALYRYSDIGATIGYVLSFNRSTGIGYFSNPPVFPSAGAGDSSTQGATTQFVATYFLPKVGGTMTGDVVFNYANPGISFNKTASGQQIQISASTNGVSRWGIVMGNSSLESGGNAGSDFGIVRYDDAGTYQGSSIFIPRSTGVVQFASAPTFPTPAAGTNDTSAATTAFVTTATSAYLPLTGGTISGVLAISNTTNSSLVLNKTAASGSTNIYGERGGLTRWWMELGNSDNETGTGNTGSNFYLSRFNDAGTYMDSPILINRASGSITTNPLYVTNYLQASNASDGDHTLLVSGSSKAIRFGTATTYAFIEGVANTLASYQPLYFGGSYLAFTVSGVEKARFDTSGNFCIGTSSSTYNLHVANSAYLGTTTTSYLSINANYPTLILNKSTGGAVANQILGYTNSVVRWLIELGNPAVETGTSNVGSDFGLHRYGDSGNYLGTSISITRSSGDMSFGSTPYFPTAAAGTNNTQGATTQFVATSFAPLANPVFSGLVQTQYLKFGGGNLAAASYATINSVFATLANSGCVGFGWNYSSGGGETDMFISRNGGSTGGLQIYDFPATSGPITKIFQVDGAGNAYNPGTYTAGGRISSGGPGTGGLFVDNSSQFVGSLNSTQMGLYNNGHWALVVDNTGAVTAPTVSYGANDTQVATTAFVYNAFAKRIVFDSDFGCVGDNSTDDTTALTNFFNHANANPGVEHRLRPLTYKITNTLPDINVSGVIIRGGGSDIHNSTTKIAGTVLRYVGGAAIEHVTRITSVDSTSSLVLTNVQFTGIGIDCNALVNAALYMMSVTDSVVDVTIIDAIYVGVYMTVVGNLASGEARDNQRNKVTISSRQQLTGALSGSALWCDGDEVANTSLNEFWVNALHGTGTAIELKNSDNNIWRQIRTYATGALGSTYSVRCYGNASSTSYRYARNELFEFTSSNRPILVDGTETFPGGQASTDHVLQHVDVGNEYHLPAVQTLGTIRLPYQAISVRGDANDVLIAAINTYSIGLSVQGTVRWKVDGAGGHLIPTSDYAYNIGGAVNRVGEFYAVNAHLTTIATGSLTAASSINTDYLYSCNGHTAISRSTAATTGGAYTQLYAADGINVAIYLGASGGAYTDPTSYYRNTGHVFGSVGGAASYLTLNSSGATLYVPTPAVNDNSGNIVTTAFLRNAKFGTIESYGGVANNSTDNVAAFNAMLADRGYVSFSSGKYYFASTITISLATTQTLVIYGVGAEKTYLEFASGCGISVNLSDATCSMNVRELSMLSRGAGNSYGFYCNMTSTVGNPANTAQSIFSNVTFRGSDGWALTNYWLEPIYMGGVSNVCYNSVNMVSGGVGTAATGYGSNGVGITIEDNASAGWGNYPVAHIFQDCTINYYGVGIKVGNNMQGLVISNSNFTGGAVGFEILGGVVGLDMVTITNSQFNCYQYGVLIQPQCANIMMTGNLFISPGNRTGISGAVGIFIQTPLAYSISANSFTCTELTGTAASHTQNLLVIGANVGGGGIITGNIFAGGASGINLQSGSVGANIQSNYYTDCTTNIAGSFTGHTIGGGSR